MFAARMFNFTRSYKAGAENYTTAGTYSFVVPTYFKPLVVEVWGGGGGGGESRFNSGPGGTGGTSSWYSSVSATGGGGGASRGGAAGTGGTASGGDINTSGPNGSGSTGGTAPNGGQGGVRVFNGGAGIDPGGGGGGAFDSFLGDAGHGAGGGAGAYSKKTYAVGALTPGITVTIIVGASGAGRPVTPNQGEYSGGAGGVGRVSVTWNTNT